MFFFLTFRIVSAVVAFLYPGYASYKTLSQRPASEQEIERWLMYWSVMGCIVAIETAEWTVSWLPLYYPFKTLFLLYLVLPQTRGASYLYIQHLQPFFHAYEHEIDAALSSLKSRVYLYVQDAVRKLWDHVAATVGQPLSHQTNILNEDGADNRGASPGSNDAGPSQLISNLWSSFGPTIVTTGKTILRQAQNAAAAAAASSSSYQTINTANTSYRTFDSAYSQVSNSPPPATQSILERRRQLEAELAALSAAQPYDVDTPTDMAIPSASSTHPRPSRTSSDGSSGLRERNVSMGKFEEVEVPSDAEGSDEQGYARPSSTSTKSTSWFGWGSGGSGGYEKVLKND